LFIFIKSAGKTQVSLKSDKNTGSVHKDHYKFIIVSHSVILG